MSDIDDTEQRELCGLIFDNVEASVNQVGGEAIAVLSDVMAAADAILAAGYRKGSADKFLPPDDKAPRYSWKFVKHIAEKSRKEAGTALDAALDRAQSAMQSVTVFVTTRERIKRPEGEDWWAKEIDAALTALSAHRSGSAKSAKEGE